MSKVFAQTGESKLKKFKNYEIQASINKRFEQRCFLDIDFY
jgi:hypothetical protein